MHPAIFVQALVIDPRTNRFNATVAAAVDRPEEVRVAIAGRFYDLIELPVALHRLKRGDVIEEEDLEWMFVRAASVSRNMLTDPSDIVGE